MTVMEVKTNWSSKGVIDFFWRPCALDKLCDTEKSMYCKQTKKTSGIYIWIFKVELKVNAPEIDFNKYQIHKQILQHCQDHHNFSLCWYQWNCLPSPFKLSFDNFTRMTIETLIKYPPINLFYHNYTNLAAVVAVNLW